MRHNDLHGALEGLRTDPSVEDRRRSVRAQVRTALNLSILEERHGWSPDVRADLIRYFGLEVVDAAVTIVKERLEGGEHHQQG